MLASFACSSQRQHTHECGRRREYAPNVLYKIERTCTFFPNRHRVRKRIALPVPRRYGSQGPQMESDWYNLFQKKLRISPGGLRPPAPPIWACWGRPRGVITWGYCWILFARNILFNQPTVKMKTKLCFETRLYASYRAEN